MTNHYWTQINLNLSGRTWQHGAFAVLFNVKKPCRLSRKLWYQDIVETQAFYVHLLSLRSPTTTRLLRNDVQLSCGSKVKPDGKCDTLSQGGHGTGKTGNLVLTFSRRGKHREFYCNTGKVFETQGKYFWLYLLTQKACFSLHIFRIFVIWAISTNIFTLPIYLLYYVTFLCKDSMVSKGTQSLLQRDVLH